MSNEQPLVLETKMRGNRIEQTRLHTDGKLTKRTSENVGTVTVRCGDVACDWGKCVIDTVEEITESDDSMFPLFGVSGARLTLHGFDEEINVVVE